MGFCVSESLLQLVYISSARADVTPATCRAILSASRLNNRRADVTGLLLFNSRRFLQVLEGPETQVRDIYTRIIRDERHYALVKLSEKMVEAREFGKWAMAFDDPEAPDADLVEQVAHLLQQAGPSTAALFTATAKLHRPG